MDFKCQIQLVDFWKSLNQTMDKNMRLPYLKKDTKINLKPRIGTDISNDDVDDDENNDRTKVYWGKTFIHSHTEYVHT